MVGLEGALGATGLLMLLTPSYPWDISTALAAFVLLFSMLAAVAYKPTIALFLHIDRRLSRLVRRVLEPFGL
jgi:hypothetical protein